MSVTSNMGLTTWESETDFYDHDELATNFDLIDQHNHTPGKGPRIPTDGILDGAITTAKLADNAVTSVKILDGTITTNDLANDSVTGDKIADGAITANHITDGTITADKLDPDVVFLGEVKLFWRPNGSTPLPTGYVVADGSILTAPDHDFPGGGSITLPDYRNKFILGAALTGTGTSTSTPPPIGQVGGAHDKSFAHTHTVTAHSHTVDAHSHNITGHVHPITIPSLDVNAHVHVLPAHQHSISSDGSHTHTVAGGHAVHQRPYEISAGGTPRQALFAASFNEGGTDIAAPIDSSGTHDHSGDTGVFSGATNSATSTTTSIGTSTAVNSNLASGLAAPSTSLESPSTTSSGPSVDIRPAHIGTLILIRVKFA